MTERTKIVTVHLRRGDYVGKAGIHGLLTVEYYTEALQMIRSRLTKVDPKAARETAVK